MGSLLLLNNIIPHRSLPNTSDGVRWSLDLRWQRPGEANGFEGIKDNIVMRSAADPDHKIPWNGWAEVDRTHIQAAVASENADVAAVVQQVKEEESVGDGDLDTTIAGPWMLQWEQTHHNRHTESLAKGDYSTPAHRAS